MAKNFQRLGFDRFQQNLHKALGSAPTNLVTGDITRGDIVEVEFDGTADTATATVKPRRTGAILIASTMAASDYQGHTISGTTLTVKYSAAVAGFCTFWVF